MIPDDPEQLRARIARFEHDVMPKIEEGVRRTSRLRPGSMPHDWPEWCQDAAQDAAVKVWRNETFRDLAAADGESARDGIRAIAHRSAQRVVIDVFRRKDRQPLPLPDDGREYLPLHGTPSARPDHLVEVRGRLQALQSLVDRLTGNQRDVMRLFLQLIEQEILPPDGASDDGDGIAVAQSLNGMIEALGGYDDTLLAHDGLGYDEHIAVILYPNEMTGPSATEKTQIKARTRVRTAKRNALDTLLRQYERCYGEPLF